MPQGTLVLPTTGTLSGLTLVQDINAALANVSGFASGATDPSTLGTGVQPFSFWSDTSVSPNILRLRNAANSAWIVIGDLTKANLGLVSQTTFQQDLYSSSVATGTADALIGAFTPAITNTTLATGTTTLTVRATLANLTATPTFTPNSGVVSPATIVKGAGAPLFPGDIAGAGHWITLQWDATLGAWVLLNPATGVGSNKVGEIFDWPSGAVLPSYGLRCDGSSGISSTTYANLFAVLVKYLSGATMTIATPGVVTWTAHGLYVNAPVKFTTTGALPTGLTVGTTYFVIAAGFGANSFQLSATIGGAAINTTGTQSGTHTAIHAPHGCANDLSTFSVPNVPVGATTVQSSANEGVFNPGNLQSHNHVINIGDPGHTHAYASLAPFTRTGELAATGSTGFMVSSRSFDQVLGSYASATGISATSNNTGNGGANNLPAGLNVRKYIRFA
jgi:hypothetical protein